MRIFVMTHPLEKNLDRIYGQSQLVTLFTLRSYSSMLNIDQVLYVDSQIEHFI